VSNKKQFVTIKGTKEGLSIFIDEACSFEEAMADLQEKINAIRPKEYEPIVSVHVKLGNRYLLESQEKELREILNHKSRFYIESIDSNVILKEDALKWKENSEIKAVRKIVRSGQVLEITGDLLLIGDVNPGGKVVSTGNVYILGNLYGIAHAGAAGDRKAIIAASYMKPTQLRIADYISRAPDYESDGVYMECGLIDEEQDKIVIDRIQVLSRNRREISGFERRILNG